MTAQHTTSTISLCSKAKRKIATSVISVGMVMAVVVLSSNNTADNSATQLTAMSQAHCQQLLNNSEDASTAQQCGQTTKTNELTWGTWLTGNSRSTQFHFMDLFELLFGSSERSGSDYNSDKKVRLG
ncbi:hypothetical protein [Pseudidiomarina sediminum]|uniref:hypothetical protein n=1 Tax=Pseudidiomarina sediminum TaxID=431675 RepID=UPI001C979563|nr:hypothetical protein [Pseudidiomarina sediminum]MBY6064381.1 hypothetical protein [Pseudidiomarina sediminum]